MSACPFCAIAAGDLAAVVLHEDDELIAFLDIAPIRRGHTQIIPKQHVDTFEQLEPQLAAKIVHLGQDLARRMKRVYSVDRVAFAFTGADVAHVHAHVIPMHEKTDVTSARYLVSSSDLRFASSHLRADVETLEAVKRELAFRD